MSAACGAAAASPPTIPFIANASMHMTRGTTVTLRNTTRVPPFLNVAIEIEVSRWY